MLDPDRARRLLDLLERHRRLLAEDTGEPFRRRHLVQMCTQICIDLAQHVIASEGLRVPVDYGDAFRVLEEASILDADLAAALVDLAGARNAIVHLYAEVDDERLRRAVQEEGRLDDLERFAAAIAGLLVEEEADTDPPA